MKLILDLPDWATYEDAEFKLLRNQELVAFKFPKDEWKVKRDRCVQCGECCLDVPEGHTPFGTNGEGKCNMLVKEGDKLVCKAGYNKPFACLGDPSINNAPGCNIRYF